MAETHRLIEVSPDDWPHLCQTAALEKEAFAEEAISPQQMALLARSGKIFLLQDTATAQIDGEAIVLPTMIPNGFLLISLAIVSSRQRRGLGKILLAEVLDRMRPLGAAYVELTVDPGNTAAFTLYTDHFGFAKVAFLPNGFGPGKDRWLLRKAVGKNVGKNV